MEVSKEFTDFRKAQHTESITFNLRKKYMGWKVECEIIQDVLEDEFTVVGSRVNWELETANANRECICQMAWYKITHHLFEPDQGQPDEDTIKRIKIKTGDDISLIKRHSPACSE